MSKKIPSGLVFSNNDPAKKKRSFILFWICLTLQLSLIWPIYPFFSSPKPQILGFPLSFAWVIFIILCSFITVLVYFKTDQTEVE